MTRLLASTALILVVASMPVANVAAESDASAGPVYETKMVLRDLWVEHVFWIRSYVIAAKAGDTGQRDVAVEQVVGNARKLADSIAPFYGQEAADALFELLAGHWSAVKTYAGAAFADDDTLGEKAVSDLTSNARQIASFLGDANPHLPEDAVFELLSVHGAHHISQINQIGRGAFAEEAETWAQMRTHMLTIADAITEALAAQFPDSF